MDVAPPRGLDESGVKQVLTGRQMMCTLMRRLWFLYIVLGLTIVMFAIVAPLFQFVMLTFFASYHGGGDCMKAPTSEPCRMAAGDLTSYNSIVGAVTSLAATVTALTLGSLSDSIGRRVIFMVKGCLSVAMLYALALYQFYDVSLWLFLVIRPLAAMWDFNGVSMAMMADVIPERNLRGTAMSVSIAIVLIVVLVSVVFAAVLPVNVSFTVAVVAGTVKLVFYFTLFPETASKTVTPDARTRQGPVGALRAAYAIITMNSFILRMAIIGVIGGMSSVGTGLTLGPYLTSYIGVKKDEMASLLIVVVASLLVWLGALATPIIAYLGEVRTYQWCLLGVHLLPVAFCVCSQPWHIMVTSAVFMGPVALQIPIISAIKSNLVHDTEQGLVQGALAALVNLASAIAAPLFGWIYNWCTDGGAAPSRSSAFPALLLASGIGLFAFVVSLTLPLQVPEPSPRSLDEPLL